MTAARGTVATSSYFYLIEGELESNDERLRTGDAAYITGDRLLRLRARAPSELLLVETVL